MLNLKKRTEKIIKGYTSNFFKERMLYEWIRHVGSPILICNMTTKSLKNVIDNKKEEIYDEKEAPEWIINIMKSEIKYREIE